MADEQKRFEGSIEKGKREWFDPERWANIETESADGTLVETMRVCQMFEELILERKDVRARCAIWDDSDLGQKIAQGWEVITEEHWRELIEEFNGHLAARHGLQVVDGGILMPNHGWVCWIPADIALRKWLAEQRKVSNMVATSLGSALDSAPGDAKAKGRLKVTFTKAGQSDAELNTLLEEQ